MRNAEFEEKDYEGPLYAELLFGSHRSATPGQVFENAFGIDAILEARHPMFWDIFGYRNVPSGVMLNDFRWKWVWKRYAGTRTLPSFPVNLLIQAKRPQSLQGRRADFAPHGINGHYWRFFITQHQQILLERLEKRLRNRALVLYASAAFDTLDRLYDLTETQQIVENSSFVRPSRLIGHDSWNYDLPGCIGVASSEPEFITDQNFQRQLNFIIEQSSESDPMEDLILLDASISEIIEQEKENPIATYFIRHEKRIQEFTALPDKSDYKFWKFMRVYSFFSLLGLSWIVYGKAKG